MREVYGTIRKLGATSKYKGYYFVAEAIRMTMEFQERPMKITKDIYPKLAKKFKSKPSNIEHDIRTIVNVCWEIIGKDWKRLPDILWNTDLPTVNL